jgi:hypothetical protein
MASKKPLKSIVDKEFHQAFIKANRPKKRVRGPRRKAPAVVGLPSYITPVTAFPQHPFPNSGIVPCVAFSSPLFHMSTPNANLESRQTSPSISLLPHNSFPFLLR